MSRPGTHNAQRPQSGIAGASCCPSCPCVSFVLIQPRNAVGGRARPGTIRGHVELRHVAAAGSGAPADGVRSRRAEHRRAATCPICYSSVVYLESAPRGAFEQSEPGHAVLDQRNETFVPHLLAITIGTTVDFPNSDAFYHNVFSLSKTERDSISDAMPRDSSEGDQVRSSRHRARVLRYPLARRTRSSWYSTIRFFALTDRRRAFTTSTACRRRAYGVIAWNEGVSSEARPVTVPDGGAAELDFTLR